MRLLVCGSRDYKDKESLETILDNFNRSVEISVLIHGGSRGADSLAGKWATNNNIPVRVFYAQWKIHGLAAGPIRNHQMLNEGQPDLVIAFPGGTGTNDMVSKAEAAGIPVRRIVSP